MYLFKKVTWSALLHFSPINPAMFINHMISFIYFPPMKKVSICIDVTNVNWKLSSLLKNVRKHFHSTLLIIFHTINFLRIIVVDSDFLGGMKSGQKNRRKFFYWEHKRVIIFPRNDKQKKTNNFISSARRTRNSDHLILN